MNEQEKEQAVEVGADIAAYAADKLNGNSLNFWFEVISAMASTLIKTIHDNSGRENDTLLLSYMEMKFLISFRDAMKLLKEQDND